MKNFIPLHFLLLLFFAGSLYAQETALSDVFTGDYKGAISELINRKLNYNPAHPDKEYEDYQVEYDYFVAKQNGKYGIYNVSKKEWFAPAVYDTINFIGNTLINGKWQNLLYGDEVAPLFPEHYLAIITVKNGKYGLKDIAGNTILEPKYDEVRANESSLNIYFYRKGAKWGFASTIKEGFVIKPDYDYAVINTDFDTQSTVITAYRNKKARNFSVWKAPKGSKKMLKPAAASNRDYVAFDNSYCYDNYKPKGIFYTEGGKNGIKDSAGIIIVPAKYNRIMPLLNGNYIVNEGNLYGLVNATGSVIIPVQYTSIDPADGRPPYNNLYIIYRDKLMAFFGADGTQLTPFEFRSSEGLMYGYSDKWEGLYLNATEKKVLERSRSEIDTTGIDTVYSKSVLLYKNNQIEKVLQGCTQTGYANEKILFYKKPGSPLYGFLSLTTLNKTEPLYNTKYTLMDNGKIWVKKGEEDIVINENGIEESLHKKIVTYANDYFIYTENGKMGAMGSNYTPLPFTYNRVEPLVLLPKYTLIDKQLVEKYSGLFRYYDETGKMGVIDAAGKILFTAGEYDAISLALSTGQDEYSAIGNKEYFYKKAPYLKEYLYKIFVCKKINGNYCDVTLYVNGNVISRFTAYASWNLQYNLISKAGYLVVWYNDDIRFIDLKTGKTIIIPATDTQFFKEDGDGGYTKFHYKGKSKTVKYTPSGEKLSENMYHDYAGGIANNARPQYISQKNGKYGLADVYGHEVMPYINDTLFSVNDVIYAALRGKRYGFVNSSNATVLPFDYDGISITCNPLSGNTKSYYSIKQNGQNGLANASGKIIVPPTYTTIDIKTFIFAEKEGVISVYDAEGKLLFSLECSNISKFTVNTFKYTKNGKQGIAGFDGKIVMQPLFDTINFIENDIYSVTDSGKTYITDAGGNKLLPFPLKSAVRLDSDYDLYNTGAKYFVLQNELGNYAVYDVTLRQITPFEYDGINEIEICRYIIARKNGLYGVTGTDGKQVLPYIYKEIDFDEDRHLFLARTPQTDYTISPEGIVLAEEKND
ncbi:WG repeat-containing protein [Flavobacterium sp. RHBU_24]|uniref:WG repeat-containing protein n=1 Tax=Flavobacterium sp. RHBU_24 TaxID=3391185 RepID=UPI00398565C6